MLPTHVTLSAGPDGLPSIEAAVDLTPAQSAAVLHALRAVRAGRYRHAELAVEDVLAMRDLTVLADDLASREGDGPVRLHADPARLGVLRGALEEFASEAHLERAGDAAMRPLVYPLVDAIADLHAEAIRTALAGQPSFS